jgi:hypothetical protein
MPNIHGVKNDCTPGTQCQIFQQLHEWAGAPDVSNIFWLSSSPGAGKSVIITTFAKELMNQD